MTQRLPELQRLGRSALQHVELIDLARTHSPSKVFEIAVARWPKRQAKAARSLAQLRRDYPEAFEAFIATVEHARSQDTEHAQERTDTMTANIAKALSHMADSPRKLELAVKHGLTQAARGIFARMLNESIPVFWQRNEHDKALFDEKADSKSPLSNVMIGLFPLDIDLETDRLNMNDTAHRMSLPGLIAALKWTRKEEESFVRTALERACTFPCTPHYFVWFVYGMRSVVRHYFTDDHPLRKQVESWILLYQFRDGRIFELRTTALPTPAATHYRELGSKRSHHEIRTELDPIIERMRELGMTTARIRDEFLIWISEKAASCRFEFMLAVADATCFEGDPESSKKRDKLVRDLYLPTIKQEDDIFCASDAYSAFDRYGGVKAWKPGDEAFLRAKAVDLLSKGHAGTVYQWVKTHGRLLNLSDRTDKAREEMLESIAKDAFALAQKSERFGIAAALSQHFPGIASTKKVRELVLLALDLEQPIALEWCSAIEKKRD